MSKVRFNPALYEALKHSKPKAPRQEVPVSAAERITSAPEVKVPRFEMEPARLNLGTQPQLVISLSATACYAVIFGLAALLAIAFILGRTSSVFKAAPPRETVRSVRPGPEPTSPPEPRATSPRVLTPTPTPRPVTPAPTAGPWRIRTFSGTQQEAERIAKFFKERGLTDVSVKRAGIYVAVFCGHFPTEQAARASSELAKVQKLKLGNWTFTDAYPQKLE